MQNKINILLVSV